VLPVRTLEVHTRVHVHCSGCSCESVLMRMPLTCRTIGFDNNHTKIESGTTVISTNNNHNETQLVLASTRDSNNKNVSDSVHKKSNGEQCVCADRYNV
jgi:hypothetical protein